MKKNFLIVGIIAIVIIVFAKATPHYSMLSGNKCVNCHYNYSGGGLRTNLGWYSKKDIALIKPEYIKSTAAFNAIDQLNDLFKGYASFGDDFRYFTYRPGGLTLGDRSYMLMQWTPTLAVT